MQIFYIRSHAELTTTILLIVKAIFLQQLVSSLVKATLSPILCPKHSVGNLFLCITTSRLNLLDAFPTRRSQGGGEMANSHLMGETGGGHQPHLKTAKTSFPPFWFTFQPFYGVQPCTMIVIAINPFESQRFSMALALLLANFIFLQRD